MEQQDTAFLIGKIVGYLVGLAICLAVVIVPIVLLVKKSKGKQGQ